MEHRAAIEAIFQRYDTLAMAGFRNISPDVKADGSVVTQVDRDASRLVWDALLAHNPEYGIVSEEEGKDHLPEAPMQWFIDPIDGTASFSRGYPIWGLGIGLAEQGTPRQGYLRFPAVDESYFFDGETLVFNGREFAAKGGFPRGEEVGDTRNVLIDSTMHRRVRSLQPFSEYKLREFGSTLYHLVCLAMGRAEAMFCNRVNMWDLAAALPLTRAAGFIECHDDGSPLDTTALGPHNRYKLHAPLAIARAADMDDILHRLREAR